MTRNIKIAFFTVGFLYLIQIASSILVVLYLYKQIPQTKVILPNSYPFGSTGDIMYIKNVSNDSVYLQYLNVNKPITNH